MVSKEDSALYATANGLVQFHQSHRHCSKCGSKTVSAKVGACRRCTGQECKSSIYPRIDTAAIMLVTSPRGGGHALLGRKAAWPKGRWSTLAGFVEVGETLEECVVRETLEESGVRVNLGSVRFAASQPWPFPRSLMVGFTAQACGEGIEFEEETPSELPAIAFDPIEMEDVRWFSREYVAARLDGGSSSLDFEPTASEAEFHIPGKASLARILITQWAVTQQ